MQTDKSKIKVLLIDGDELFTKRFSSFLAKHNIEVNVFTETSLQNLDKHTDTVFIIDFSTAPISPDIFYTAFANKRETIKLIVLQDFFPALLNDLLIKTCSTKSDFPAILAHINDFNTDVATSPLFDLTFLLEQASGNAEFVAKMKQAFKKNVLEKTVLIEQYVRDNNIEAIQKIVHQLKPSILHLRINVLKETIQALEQKTWNTSNNKDFLKHTIHFVDTLRKVAELF